MLQGYQLVLRNCKHSPSEGTENNTHIYILPPILQSSLPMRSECLFTTTLRGRRRGNFCLIHEEPVVVKLLASRWHDLLCWVFANILLIVDYCSHTPREVQKSHNGMTRCIITERIHSCDQFSGRETERDQHFAPSSRPPCPWAATTPTPWQVTCLWELILHGMWTRTS